MKNVLLTVVFAVVLSNLSFSQYNVSGKITNVNGEPLPGAHIVLPGTYKSAVTDNNGKYTLSKLKSGKYTLVVSYIGYETLYKPLLVGGNTTLDLAMQPKTYLEDEVIITATRAGVKSPQTYENVSKEEIKEINFGQDLPYVMQTTPSTVVTSDAGAGVGYTGIRIRGTDITRINVTINGIPLNDPESQGVFWVNMPDFASSIDNIQIQRGVGTSTNGAAAFGASINIQTLKLNPDPYANFNSIAGSFNTFKNNITFGTGLIGGRWSFDGRLSKISSDGYIDRASSKLKSFFLSGGYFGEKDMLKIVMFSGREKTYQAWSGVPKDSLKTNRTYNPYTYDNETDNYQQDHYQLHYSRQLGKQFYLNASLFYIHGEGYYEQYREDDPFSDYGLPNIVASLDTVINHDTLTLTQTITQTNLVRQKWLDNNFYGITYSVRYHSKKVTGNLGGAWNRYEGDHFGKIIWAEYASNMDHGYKWYTNTGTKTDFNIFGKMEYRHNNRLNFYGDLQFRRVKVVMQGLHDDRRDISQGHEFDFFNPKAGVYYDLSDNQGIYFSFALSNREPSRNNYRDADDNNAPKAERLFDYELGYKLSKPGLGLEANLFYMDYKDQLVMTGKINNVGSPIMTNVPVSYRAGIEMLVGIKVHEKINLSVNATISRNKIKDFVAYVDNWSPPYGQVSEDLGETDLSFSPGITAGSHLVYQAIEGLNINWISKFVSRQYIDNTSNKERSLDPYFINDLVINYSIETDLIKKIGFHLMLNNLFNIQYETFAWVYRYMVDNEPYVMDGYFPQAGINLMGGVTLEF